MGFSFDISSGIQHGPQKIVVYGPEGIGKSSFAAEFPEPLFIDTEGSTKLLEVRRLPRPESWAILNQMIDEIAGNPEICKTLVIDTVDWAERLCSEYVCRKGNKQSIEEFGYGKGYVLIKEEFGRMLDRLNVVIESGINVVLTAHCILRKFERPDESGAYDRWELKLGNKAGSQISALIKEWSDALFFVNYKEHVIEDPTTHRKKAHGGERVMYTTHRPAFDAKNRYGLKDELPFSFAEIACCLPNSPEEVTKKQEPEAAAEEPKKPAPKKKAAAKKPPLADAYAGIPEALAELMKKDKVTRDELQAVVGMRGYFPMATPIEKYPQDFIDGCLVAAWDQVLKFVDEIRNPLNVPF